MPDFVETPDFLNNSSSLRKHSIERTNFDPNHIAHIASLRKFIETGNWGDIQFFCESPYTDVPTTVLMKYCSYQLNVQRFSLSQQSEYLANKKLETYKVETMGEAMAQRQETNNRTRELLLMNDAASN